MKKWLALWPTSGSINLLKSKGTLRDDLHLTCYYSPHGDKFETSSPIVTKCTITGIEKWENANVVVALCEFEDRRSHNISDIFERQFGVQTLPHRPHITLGSSMKDSYYDLIGLEIHFDRFGTEI